MRVCDLLLYLRRQRRRILLTAILITLALVIDVAGWAFETADIDLLRAMVLISLAAAISFSVAAFVTSAFILVARPFRHAAELVGLVLFTDAGLSAAAPDSALSGPASLGVLLAGFVLLLPLRGLDRLPFRFSIRSVDRFNAANSAESLWRWLIPGAAPVADHWDKRLVSATPEAGPPHRLRLTYRIGARQTEDLVMEVVENDMPHQFRASFRVDGTGPTGHGFERGEEEITISPRLGGCTVTSRTERHGLRAGTALKLWLDDVGGDAVDHMVASQRPQRDWSLYSSAIRQRGGLA